MILTCSTTSCVYEERRTTTKSTMTKLSNSSFFPNQMKHMFYLLSALIHHYVKVKRDMVFWSFNSQEKKTWKLNSTLKSIFPAYDPSNSSDVYKQEYASRLKKEYDAPAYDVVSSIFRGLTGRKIITPGTFSSHLNQPGVKCALKASEGILYPLEKYLLFVPKPTILIELDDIDYVTFSRYPSPQARD